MRFETLTEDKFAAWDDACDRSDDAWHFHTTDALRYQDAYSAAFNGRNLSFFIYDHNGDVLGVCPLFVERHMSGDREVVEFSAGASQLPNPALINGLTPRRRNEVLKAVFEHLDALAVELGAVRCSFRASPLSPIFDKKEESYNFLTRFGFLDTSISSHVIDCSQPLEQLRGDLRKGHLSDVKRGCQLLELAVIGKEQYSPELFKAYQDLHFKAAGRATRSQHTFDILAGVIKKGRGILIAARKDNRFVGFSLVVTYKNRAYYGSAANDPEPEYSRLPIAHAIQWTTMEWLNRHGHSFYEIGWQYFGNQLHSIPTEKDLQIAHFKRGFGGHTTSLFSGEKYYDHDFCQATLSDRLSKYLKAGTWKKN